MDKELLNSIVSSTNRLRRPGRLELRVIQRRQNVAGGNGLPKLQRSARQRAANLKGQTGALPGPGAASEMQHLCLIGCGDLRDPDRHELLRSHNRSVHTLCATTRQRQTRYQR